MRHESRLSTWLSSAGVLAVAALLALGSLALAQEPAPMPPVAAPAASGYLVRPIPQAFADKKNRDEAERHAREVLQGKQPLAGPGVVTKFAAYYENYIFAMMTQEDQLPYLYELREKYFGNYRYIKETPIQEFFTKLTLKNMREIAAGNYHPAVRHNAMLIIGELNDREVPAVGPKVAPEPMREALTVMAEELKKPGTPDAVRVACLVGMLRHAELDAKRPPERRLPDVFRNEITKTMLAIVNQQISRDSPGYDGRMWMKRLAMDILGAFGAVGEGDKVYTTLDALVGDEKAPTSLRLSAAVTLGRLTYPPTLKVDATALAAKIASVATAAVQDELARIKERQLRIESARSPDFRDDANPGPRAAPPRIAPPPLGIPGRPREPGVPAEGPAVELTDAERRTEIAKRRLRQELYYVQQGLSGRNGDGGILTLAKSQADGGQAVARFQKAVTDMQIECEGSQPDLELFSVAIQRHSALLLSQLQPFLRPAPGAAGAKPVPVEDMLPP